MKLKLLVSVLALWPVLSMGAIKRGLREIHETGTQEGQLDQMQTRSRLYELLEYERYNEFDSGVFNFTLGGNQ